VRTVLDTTGAALPAALRSGPDIIKPNQHELEALVGRALPTEAAVIAAARALVAGGVGLVVVSRGPEGACFVTDEAVVVARPPAVTVGSTVGAGDAMVAGLVIAQIRGASIADTARFATACAVAALTAAAGATDGELRERIAALEPRVDLVEA
jgi:1-phosphofructokinase